MLPPINRIAVLRGSKANKTRMSLAEKATADVKSGHSYETPAVLVLPILGGSQPYIDWIMRETKK